MFESYNTTLLVPLKDPPAILRLEGRTCRACGTALGPTRTQVAENQRRAWAAMARHNFRPQGASTGARSA